MRIRRFNKNDASAQLKEANREAKKAAKKLKNEQKQKEINEKVKKVDQKAQKQKSKIRRYFEFTYHQLMSPLKKSFWLLLTIVATYVPVYFAQLYESEIYSMHVKMDKFELAHYTNMIEFGYRTASIATVIIGYLMLKKFIEMCKKNKNGEDK